MNIKKIDKIRVIKARAGSFSMTPVINPGDSVTVLPLMHHEIQIGDIVVFYKKERFISHRMIFKYRDFFLIKGDNEKYFDQKVNQKAILGIISHTRGKNGNLCFSCFKARIIAIYYIVYSLFIFIAPQSFSPWIRRFFRGRKFLVRTFLNID